MASTLLLVALAAVTISLSRWINKRHLHLPPGPAPDPVLGNARHMPSEKQEQAFFEWSKTYGDVIYTQVLGHSIIILNSFKAARDLLDRRSAIYSCRPRMVLLCELMGWQSSLVHMPYGERFHKHRRWILDYFGDQAVVDHRYIQREGIARMLLNLLERPAAYTEHLKLFTATTIMRIAYGHKIKSSNDLYFRYAEEATEATVASGTSMGGVIINFIPALRHIPTWMPGAGFKRRAIEARVKIDAFHDAPFDMVRQNLASGDLVPSFTSRLLVENENEPDPAKHHEPEEIRGAAGTLYGAAMDTTSATISAFYLAMARHPRVAARAQAEIDAVIGFERLPELHDRASLPYLECIVNELYRWHVAVPLGVPHRLVQDDQYRGFDLPNGAMIMANSWAMSRDEEVYEKPDEFIPERFENLSPDDFKACDPKSFVFGFGRRQCPGKTFADANVFLVVASVLAAFDISAGDNPIPPEEFLPGFVRHAKPFPCKITVRNPQRARQIVDLAFTTE